MNKTKQKSIVFLIIIFSVLTAIGQTPNNLITKDSVGDVKLGMTVGEARKVLPKSHRFDEAGGSEGVVFLGIYDGQTLLMEIGMYYDGRETDKKPPVDENQKITGITIHDSRYKTVEGVHVGMPIAEGEKKYGKLKEMFNYPHMGEFGKFTNQPNYLNFYFKPKGDKTEAGIYEEVPNCPEDAYPPSCRVAKKYNPNSYISEISVSSPRPVQQVTSITDTPKDFKVNVYGPEKCAEDKDYGDTTYFISWKVPLKNGGYSLQSQSFNFEGLKPCPELGYEENQTTVSYKDQWDVFLDDFNFDGMTDLALRDGNNGGYGFPSYQVYLFSKGINKFVLSPSFTKLGQYQGMFEVNKDKKMIYNHTKSGCCSHTTEGYKIVNNKPFKVYDHTVEGSVEVANGVTTPEVITKKLVNGKWRTWDKSSAARVSFDKGKTSKTISIRLTKNEPVKWLKVGASKGQIMKATVNSAKADVRLVDFIGDVSSYESYEPLKEGENFPVKLKGNGDYHLEVSAEEDLTVSLTISIKNDDGKTDVSDD
jgi:hypothetical protein